jgi:ankyrin repeat protein
MKKLLAVTILSALVFGAVAVNAEDADSLTPKEQIIKQIIQKNYNYDATGVLKALKNNDKDVISLFIASGYDPNITILKMPAIYWAIKLKKPDIVEKLLDAGVDPNQEVNGKSLMAHAISTENVDTVKSLLKHGAKVNDMSAGKSLLTLAVSKKSEEISNLLINAGANIDETSLNKALKLNNSTLKDLILTNYKKQD